MSFDDAECARIFMAIQDIQPKAYGHGSDFCSLYISPRSDMGIIDWSLIFDLWSVPFLFRFAPLADHCKHGLLARLQRRHLRFSACARWRNGRGWGAPANAGRRGCGNRRERKRKKCGWNGGGGWSGRGPKEHHQLPVVAIPENQWFLVLQIFRIPRSGFRVLTHSISVRSGPKTTIEIAAVTQNMKIQN